GKDDLAAKWHRGFEHFHGGFQGHVAIMLLNYGCVKYIMAKKRAAQGGPFPIADDACVMAGR
ncbi:MAG: hypothetical protein ACYC9P_05230, partial [Rudaea sp.]